MCHIFVSSFSAVINISITSPFCYTCSAVPLCSNNISSRCASWRWTADAPATRSSWRTLERQTSWWARHWPLDHQGDQRWPTVTNGDQYVIRRCCCSDVVIYLYMCIYICVYICISVYIYINIWDSGIFKIIHVKICRVGCDLRCRTAKDYSGASTTFDASRKAGEDLTQNKNLIDILL